MDTGAHLPLNDMRDGLSMAPGLHPQPLLAAADAAAQPLRWWKDEAMTFGDVGLPTSVRSVRVP